MKESSIIDRNSSGAVYVQGEYLVWRTADDSMVKVNLNEVVLIGEYTTDEGPIFDDWFLAFVYADGSWDKISVYADRIDEIIEYLGTRFNFNSSFHLANSAVWNSNIFYPKILLGTKLFEMTSPDGYKEPKTFLDHIKVALGIGKYGKAWYFDLSPEVRQYLLMPSLKSV